LVAPRVDLLAAMLLGRHVERRPEASSHAGEGRVEMGFARVRGCHAAVRRSLDFLLHSARYKTRTYETALAFLNALPDIPSGCIVTDWNMPEMSGVELLRHLRERNLRIPVIIINSGGAKYQELGAIGFIGPAPLNFARFIPLVDYTARVLGRILDRQEP